MLPRIGRRAFELVVSLFALLGFFFVPLGKKTGFEHAKAIFVTPPAQEAGRELLQAGDKIKTKLLDEARPKSKSDGGRDGGGTSLMRVARMSAPSDDDAPDASVPYVSR